MNSLSRSIDREYKDHTMKINVLIYDLAVYKDRVKWSFEYSPPNNDYLINCITISDHALFCVLEIYAENIIKVWRLYCLESD